MGFDEKFFGWIYKSKKRREREKLLKILNSRNAFTVADHEKELCVFASALWNRAIDVKPMLGLGDYDGKTLFLPEHFCISSSGELNKQAALLRILHEGAWESNKGDRLSLSSALEAEYPNYTSLVNKVLSESDSDCECIWPRPREFFDNMVSLSGQDLALPTQDETKQNENLELKALPKNRVKKLEQLKDENIGDIVFHCFEKIETIEEYSGVDRKAEPEESLNDKSAALEELKLESVIRSNERTTQNYAVDMIGGFEVSTDSSKNGNLEAGEKQFYYDEWDYSKKTYKKKWCVVVEKTTKELLSNSSVRTFDFKTYEKLKRIYLKLKNQRKTQKKLYTGSSIDIDQVVKNYALHKASGNIDERVYKRQILRHRDLATYILLDSSLSSDSWVNGKRVLDESLSSLDLLSRLLKDFNDPIALASFYSNTRLECHFDILKSYDESWIQYESRVSGIQPQGYTRIGPALRHATAQLDKRKEAKKLLILISDSKPTDFDRYEGSYGIADTARAVLEASSKGILTHTFTFEENKKSLLPRMFKKNNYTVLENSGELPIAFAGILQRLSKNRVH